MSEVNQEEVQQPVQAVETVNETQVEVKVRDYSDEELFNSALKNKSVYDKIYNQVRDKFISKTLGVDTKELTDEHRKLELIPKTEYEKVNSEFNMFKKQSDVKSAFGDKFDLLNPHIDYTKDTAEEIERVKTTFASQFEIKTPVGKMKEVSPTPTQPKSKEARIEELKKLAPKDKKARMELRKLLTQ